MILINMTLSNRLKIILAIGLMVAVSGCTTSEPSNGSPVYYSPSPEQAPRSIATAAEDTFLLAKVKAKFVSDDLVDDSGIDITVRHGVVILEGTAQDAHHRRMAVDLARTVDGVVRVENRLRLIHTGTTFETPETIVQNKIKMALIQDPQMSGQPIVVEATPTYVVLSGKVVSQEQKQKAAAIAAEHAHDRQVINQISVLN